MLNQTFILEYVDEGFLLHESASLRHPRYLPNEDNFDPKICDLCRHGRREVWYNVRNAPREPPLWGRCKKSCQLTTGARECCCQDSGEALLGPPNLSADNLLHFRRGSKPSTGIFVTLAELEACNLLPWLSVRLRRSWLLQRKLLSADNNCSTQLLKQSRCLGPRAMIPSTRPGFL
jgi:hypothetical protein